jgi:signal peptidase I
MQMNFPITEAEKPYQKRKWIYSVLEVLQMLLFVLILYLVINLAFERVEVLTPSMENTLAVGDRLVVNKLAYLRREPDFGEVIVFNPPIESEAPFIKRLIGTPGDEIRITDGSVFLNGDRLDEPYLMEAMQLEEEQSWIIPEGFLFVMGDNRNASNDSRSWGFVSREQVIGKAVFIFWPFGHIKKIGL